MNCALIQPELVLYHFGTIAPESRAEVESHLLSCRECLSGYLALKRHLESEPDSGPRPSPAARVRLRDAVEREFGRSIASRSERPAAGSGGARPRPLSVTWRRAASWGLAAAAAAAIAAVAFQGGFQTAHTPLGTGQNIPVDSANPCAAGLNVL